jgi:hypothetical protein
VAILEDVRFNNEIFGYDPLDRITAAIYQRSHVLNHNGWKRPSHARSINPRFTWSERTNPVGSDVALQCAFAVTAAGAAHPTSCATE